MKILKQTVFAKLDNDLLENILEQMIKQYNVIQIFYTKDHVETTSHLVIHLYKSQDVANLRSSKWISKLKLNYKINVYFVCTSRFEYHFKLGHPFIEFYCQPSAIICQNESSGIPFIISRGWKKYKKKFNDFENRFHHDHDLHLTQIKRLIAEDSPNSVFTSYEELISYDLEYLEDLYSAQRSNSMTVSERVKGLVKYIPEIQNLFIKKNHSEYYLTELFAKAKKAADEYEIVYETEMYDAVGITEEGLFRLVENRFYELKQMIKKEYSESSKSSNKIISLPEEPKDEVLEVAIERILCFTELEQIYFFHKTIYGEITTYYLLLLGLNIGNEKLSSITKSLKSTFGKQCDFLLLSHDRYWIQTNLYQYQNFFAHILQEKHLIHSSHQYHPEFHWGNPHNPYHSDLFIYYKVVNDSASQFYKVIEGEHQNYQGVSNLFSLFFLSFCRIYIFVKTFYLPNYLSSQSLWQLCIYADKDIYKYNYLIDQFFTDLFPYLDYNRSVHHRPAKLDKGNIEQMNVIVKNLINELRDIVVAGGLLNDSQFKLLREAGE